MNTNRTCRAVHPQAFPHFVFGMNSRGPKVERMSTFPQYRPFPCRVAVVAEEEVDRMNGRQEVDSCRRRVSPCRWTIESHRANSFRYYQVDRSLLEAQTSTRPLLSFEIALVGEGLPLRLQLPSQLHLHLHLQILVSYCRLWN